MCVYTSRGFAQKLRLPKPCKKQGTVAVLRARTSSRRMRCRRSQGPRCDRRARRARKSDCSPAHGSQGCRAHREGLGTRATRSRLCGHSATADHVLPLKLTHLLDRGMQARVRTEILLPVLHLERGRLHARVFVDVRRSLSLRLGVRDYEVDARLRSALMCKALLLRNERREDTRLVISGCLRRRVPWRRGGRSLSHLHEDGRGIDRWKGRRVTQALCTQQSVHSRSQISLCRCREKLLTKGGSKPARREGGCRRVQKQSCNMRKCL